MSSLPFFDDPFTYQLLNVHLVDEEYIVLEVLHGRGKFVGTKFRNEIHIKSKDITLGLKVYFYEERHIALN